MFLEVLADLVDTSAPPECQASVVVPGAVIFVETISIQRLRSTRSVN